MPAKETNLDKDRELQRFVISCFALTAMAVAFCTAHCTVRVHKQHVESMENLGLGSFPADND